MTALQIYTVALNTMIAGSIFLIAIYLIKSYNILVVIGATNTAAPMRGPNSLPAGRVDRAEVSASFDSINMLRETWIKAGYSIVSAHRSGAKMNLVMTKILNDSR
jgi:hypothetical protein